jgi:hypothetical protein
MLLVMLLVWILSGLTFFFDYYRVPILSLLLLLAGAVALRDHTFEARPYGGKPNALLPQDVVAPRTLSLDRPLVVIASAGGGIQAAGWTARVLAGIAQAADSDEEYTAFLQQLVVVSGVSGGSVGLAPFVLALDEHATRGTVLRSVDSALTSSLDAVAAAFATFDLLPLSFSDRGSALEENWKRAWKAADLEPAVTLTDLLARTTRGVTPAIMFNATDMTTGERLIIGTTIPRAGQKGVVHAAHLAVEPKTNRVTIDYAPRPQVGDIELAVAARLSATFPFVTPASRCVSCASRDYIVDGGYIDNYGTESLVEWVSPLLAENEARSVLVVQIVSFPESDTAPASGRLALPVPGAPSQLAAPVQAVLNVRAPGQGRRAAYDLDVLQQRFPGRVTWLRFVYEGCRNGSGGVPPLSWHLTAAQKKDLDEWWKGCPHGKGNVWSGYESKARELLDLVLRPSKPSAESVQRQQNTSEIDTSSPKALAAE